MSKRTRQSKDNKRGKKNKKEPGNLSQESSTEPEVKRDEVEEKLSKDPTLLEMGHIYFLYRPKVGLTATSNFEDVQKLLILLLPKNGNPRLLHVPKKALPNIKKHGKHFAGVGKVNKNIDEVIETLGEHTYTTKTRGEKTQAKACMLGIGVYGFSRHENHTHLAYVLDYPKDVSPLHGDFGIEKEANYIVSVKNPDYPAVGFFSSKERPKYPDTLIAHFQSKKWAPLIPELLDYEGTQLILIGNAEPSIAERLHELEDLAEAEVKCVSQKDLFSMAHLDKWNLPADPMKGKFV